MNEIILKFNGLGYGDKCQAGILIYDSNGNLIIKKDTYNGIVKVCLDKNEVYYLYARSLNEVIKTCFYVDKNCYIFHFPRSIYSDIFTFLLYDSSYEGLKIEKGELLLWQKQ